MATVHIVTVFITCILLTVAAQEGPGIVIAHPG